MSYSHSAAGGVGGGASVLAASRRGHLIGPDAQAPSLGPTIEAQPGDITPYAGSAFPGAPWTTVEGAGLGRWGQVRRQLGRFVGRRRATSPSEWLERVGNLASAPNLADLRRQVSELAALAVPGVRVAFDSGYGPGAGVQADAGLLVVPVSAWETNVGQLRVERPTDRELTRAEIDRLEKLARVLALVMLGAGSARPRESAEAGGTAILRTRRDSVTGLPHFESLETFVLETRHERPGDRLVLLLILPDRLAPFREAKGHVLADAGLTLVGRAVRNTLRASDRVVRLSGDWIAAALTRIDRANALRVGETVRCAIAEAGLTSSTPWPLTASLGLVSSPEDGTETRELCQAAHRAVARAVSRGGNHLGILPPVDAGR